MFTRNYTEVGGTNIEMKQRHSTSLEHDYQYCERIIQKHSKSLYFAFSKLPKEKAQAVYAIYAFCRLADDSIDEAVSREDQEKALTYMTEELNKFEAGNESDHPILRALRDVFNRYDMSIQPFYDQLKGQEMDYYFKQPATLEDLETYSYYVAGSVGLMLLPIIASKNHHTLKDEAVALGVAMQLTNILRDVGEDYQKNNRIYLLSELMKKERYTEEDIAGQHINESFIMIWETLATRAEALYDVFNQSISLYDEDSQFPVLLSAKVYGGILDAVRTSSYDCYSKRNQTSARKKMALYNETKMALSK